MKSDRLNPDCFIKLQTCDTVVFLSHSSLNNNMSNVFHRSTLMSEHLFGLLKNCVH